jgi:hypothetical protein
MCLMHPVETESTRRTTSGGRWCIRLYALFRTLQSQLTTVSASPTPVTQRHQLAARYVSHYGRRKDSGGIGGFLFFIVVVVAVIVLLKISESRRAKGKSTTIGGYEVEIERVSKMGINSSFQGKGRLQQPPAAVLANRW